MRHFIRHPSDIPMDYRVTRYRPSRRDRLKNISPGGLCFETPEALERGCAIQITILSRGQLGTDYQCFVQSCPERRWVETWKQVFDPMIVSAQFISWWW